MARFPQLSKALRDVGGFLSVDEARQPYEEGHSPADARRRRGSPNAMNKGERRRGRERKQPEDDSPINRTATVGPDLQRQLRRRDAIMKPYDANFLKEIAEHPIVQAYMDTMAQDMATAPWDLVRRDEEATIEDDELASHRRTLENIHPEQSFRDVREMTARNMLTLGDAAWIKHYYERSGEFAEAIPVDSARMFKQVNTHGITEGYIQASLRDQAFQDNIPLTEVVWFEWSSRPDHVYGYGPVEKGVETIELLDELSEKELKDLTEGMPPAIVSVNDDADTVFPEDEFETVQQNWQLEEGERHRAVVSRGEWNVTPLQPGYSELQVLDRSKYWVKVLGAVFKVNSSYAGFDIENVNRATDESQAEAYAQRGFRVLLRQMEESINRQLVWADMSEQIKFEFDRQRTFDEQKKHAEFLKTLAQTAQEWDKAGREVHFREGDIEIEDGPIDVEEPDPADGPFGGGFGMDEQSPVEASTDGLTKAELDALDEILLSAHESQIQPESLDAIEKMAWSGDDSVPQFVVDKIDSAIDAGAVFDAIEGIPSATTDRLEGLLQDNLTQSQGWSLKSIVDDMKDVWPGVDEDKLEAVARTETASVLNEAREQGYEERDDSARYKFKWQGPSDSRTTTACEELKEETNPKYGGTPQSMNDLLRMEQDVAAQYFPTLSFRKHTIHPNERHTFVRSVSPPGP